MTDKPHLITVEEEVAGPLRQLFEQAGLAIVLRALAAWVRERDPKSDVYHQLCKTSHAYENRYAGQDDD